MKTFPFSCEVSTEFCGTPLRLDISGTAYTSMTGAAVEDMFLDSAEVTEAEGKAVRFALADPNDLLDVRRVWDQIISQIDHSPTDRDEVERTYAAEVKAAADSFNAMFASSSFDDIFKRVK